MNATKTILSTAILAATLGYATGAAAAAFTYGQTTGFVFNTVTPTNTNIGRDAGSLGLVVPTGGQTGATYESLWWGNDNPAREEAAGARGTPIITTGIDTTGPWTGIGGSGGVVTSAPTAAAWTTSTGGNGLPDSAVKVVGLSGTVTSVASYVDPLSVANPIAAGWAPIAVALHSNQTISVGDTGLLTSGIVRSNLEIPDNTPIDPNNSLEANDVAFSFFETPNANSIYNCPDGSGVSCDIFALSLAGFSQDVYDDGTNLYDVYFGLIGVSPNAFIITPTQYANWGDGYCNLEDFLCVLTKENNVNWVMTGMLFVERQVPEPGTLAVLGLGLAGMGATLRRRKARS